jgi:hypothetical protein
LPNKLDDILRKKLEDAEVAPPPDLWNKIEAQLPKQASSKNKYKYLLLLLLFISSSTGSVFVYESFLRDNILKFEKSTIERKNLASTEKKDNNSNNIQNKTQLDNQSSAKIISNKTNNNNNQLSVINTKNKNNTQSNELNDKSKYITAKKEKTTNQYKTPQTISTEKASNSNNNINTEYLASNNKTKKQKGKINNTKSDAVATNYDSNKTNKQVKNKNTVTENNANLDNITQDDVLNSTMQAYENNLNKQNAENLIASIDVIPASNINTPRQTTAEILQSFYPEKDFSLDEGAALTEYEKQKEKQLKNLKEFAGVDVTKGFHAGVLLSIHNNWLTSKNSNKESNNNQIKYKVDFGKSFGVNLGYDYTSRWGIQTEIAYNEQGQKYTEITSNNQKLNKELDLAYLRVPLMVKYKINFINNYNSKPVIVNFLFGPQVNLLLSKKTTINDKKEDFKSAYNKGEFGLYGGVDFDLFMTKNFYMTVGSRLGFGTALKKNTPKSFQIGITTQFNFKKPAKIKK